MAPPGKRGRKKPRAAEVASSGKHPAASNLTSTASRAALPGNRSGVSHSTFCASPASFGKRSGVSCRTSTASPFSRNSLLSTPIKVLRDQRKRKRKEDPQREERELRALVNCVVSAAEGVDEEPLCFLRDLLDHGISPNTGIGQPEVMRTMIIVFCGDGAYIHGVDLLGRLFLHVDVIIP